MGIMNQQLCKTNNMKSSGFNLGNLSWASTYVNQSKQSIGQDILAVQDSVKKEKKTSSTLFFWNLSHSHNVLAHSTLPTIASFFFCLC